ncbi:MAG: DUF4340 domain-containing protein [Anaerolineales bacterium]|nr:DUF4340 domain-containing protein [Anaerolineales bacterium]
MTQLQKILSGLLALQVVLVAVVFWPRQAAETAAGLLFPDVEAAQITAVSFADNEGVEVDLVRQGGGWVLANGGDYPADGTKIEPILDKIVALRGDRLVAQTATSQAQLQVAEDAFVRRVQFTTSAGETYTLYMGSAPTAQATHMRRADQDETYLVGGLNVWEASQNASGWIDTAYTNLDLTTITAVSLQNGNGTFNLSQAGDQLWTLADLAEGESVNQTNVSTLLSRISSLRLLQPLGTAELPQYGLASPQAQVLLTVEADNASRTYTLLIGAQNPDSGNYIVKWSDADYYVEVSSFSVESMVNYGRADLLEVPIEPTALPLETPTDTGG